MAGVFDRLPYDECATQQYTATSKSPELYQLFIDYNENTLTSVFNQGAQLSNTLASKNRRVEIENDLLLINLPGTKCATKKFEACTPAGKNKCEYENVVINKLNDRQIVPTNMVPFVVKQDLAT